MKEQFNELSQSDYYNVDSLQMSGIFTASASQIYDIQLAFASQFAKSLNTLYELSNTQKPVATRVMVQTIAALMILQGKNFYVQDGVIMRLDPIQKAVGYWLSQGYIIGEGVSDYFSEESLSHFLRGNEMVKPQVEKDGKTIEFAREIVEKVYEFLSFSEKYSFDIDGNLWEHDPVGVVRNALEGSGYELDPLWYSWGTKSSTIINDISSLINFKRIYEGSGSLSGDIGLIKKSNSLQGFIKDQDIKKSRWQIDIFTALINDEDFINILKQTNENYKNLKRGDIKNILKACGIEKHPSQLTDADILKIARIRFGWDDSIQNVAYLTYRIKIGSDVHTGIIFAASGVQELYNIPMQSKKGYRFNVEYVRDILNSEIGKDIYNIIGTRKKPVTLWSGWHAETKILATLLEIYGKSINEITEFDMSLASEWAICSHCYESMLKFVENFKNNNIKTNLYLRTHKAPRDTINNFIKYGSLSYPLDFFSNKYLIKKIK